MYKVLLCWRYLRTRYIALASIISVTLGVATMIVVNSVMEGFTSEMQDRIHGMLSDVVIESHGLDGFPDAEWHMMQIEKVAGQYIESMTPIVQVPAFLMFPYGDTYVKNQVQLVGIDAKRQNATSDFGRYLLHPANRRQMSFNLRDGGFDAHNDVSKAGAPDRPQLRSSGLTYRKWKIAREKELRALRKIRERIEPYNNGPALEENSQSSRQQEPTAPDEQSDFAANEPLLAEFNAPLPDKGEISPTEPPESIDEPSVDAARGDIAATDSTSEANRHASDTNDPFRAARQEEIDETEGPSEEPQTGIVLGIGLGSFRDRRGNERFLILPGDDVILEFPTATTPPKPVEAAFTVIDFWESKMSEFDGSLVFVPLDKLQELACMVDPQTGVRYVNSIQIKVKDNVRDDKVRDLLRAAFPPESYGIYTWRDKQGVLLAAVQMETAILNVLLFLIIAVAGFGILAIFFMIVVEKTRDIGILKSLGAPNRGVMGIFLSYGLLLGIVGSGAGMILGLVFVDQINPIAKVVGKITGHEVFDPSIYNFYEIPTIVEPFTVAWIVTGAMLIAVLASVLPARRAARLHPVEALRYE